MMTRQYDPKVLEQYRRKAVEIGELRRETGERIGRLPHAEALREFEHFTARSHELDTLGQALGPIGLFIAAYDINVIDDHRVSLVIPKGRSRIQILEQANNLIDQRRLIDIGQLRRWQVDPRFVACAERSERICIDGHVPILRAMKRQDQELLLQRMGLQMPSIEDLAVAFVAFWCVTGEPLLGWYGVQGNRPFSFLVRAATGALHFDWMGLVATGAKSDSVDHARVTAAARFEP